MLVMPANSSGWFWHSLARETGKIGHLYSPGAQRGPWPWFPYACDNGVFSMWNPQDNSFDEDRWENHGEAAWRHLLFWCGAAAIKPMWAIVPDRPGRWDITLEKWHKYRNEIISCGIPAAIAVQDGATPNEVKKMNPDVVAVGGTTEWKWKTAEQWILEFPRVHILRCNSPEKLHWLEDLGCESCDGTGWNRGNRVQTQGIELWARKNPTPTSSLLWPHTSRAQCINQLSFA
jgi:hypothetical protein